MRMVKVIIAVVLGLILGSMVNMGFIVLGTQLVPPPLGTHTKTIEGLQHAIQFFEFRHYIFPFMAHLMGTFSGALLAAVLCGFWHPLMRLKASLAVGGFFFLGGLANVIMIPASIWFSSLDLIVAYLPTAYLAYLLSLPLVNDKTI